MRVALIVGLALASFSPAAERITLSPGNYDQFVPHGKEVDAIYGDYVLRNDRLVMVVAAPGETRDANVTVRNVGGSVIDLTEREEPSDQLSCFYPGGGAFRFTQLTDWRPEWGDPSGATLAFEGKDENRSLELAIGYALSDGAPYVRVVSTVKNTGSEPIEFMPTDGVRCDGEFKFGVDHEANLWWAYDRDWRQAYGVQPESPAEIDRQTNRDRRTPNPIIYPANRETEAPRTIEPGDSFSWTRRLFPAASNVGLQGMAYEMLGEPVVPASIDLTDGVDPIADGNIRVIRTPPGGGAGERVSLGVGVTDEAGRFRFKLPAGDYAIRVTAQGHKPLQAAIRLNEGPGAPRFELQINPSAYAQGNITDASGRPIPAKVQFSGVGDTPAPNFGPESAVTGVKNVQYTPDGTFRCKLLPGEYRWIASYGSEYDAAYGSFTVAANETARINAKLPRVVDTTGWLSSELHSHSSPSGDNTASQAGRVLNLLAEHLEFCPCTEHQRLDVYDEHLAAFDAQHRMLTCPGMELTGTPLPLNHQNAFPLVHKPHTQDGGGPQTDPNPVEQIKRLAGWDDNSVKVVQTNHPDIAQMVGDRDENGVADEGFEAMFGYMDVIEVHPPELIFQPIDPNEPTESGVGTGGWEGRGNSIINWLQLLNLGYRVTGVVNTDAHYNWHGSGWMRNWVKSSTDDPAEATVAEMIDSYERGHVVVSNGPFMQVTVSAGDSNAIPGDDLEAAEGKVKVRVVVRVPNWIEINRVQLFLNGRPAEAHNYTARSHREWFAEGPEVFNQTIDVELQGDTHIVVACCGEGQSIASMYGVEDWGRNIPVAVSNPVFVDTDGDADRDGIVFEPNRDDLGLALPRLDGVKPSHGHDHPNHKHGH